ncbi:MDR family MFS transporter [Heyndrickxia sp. NPDC080065]|uniref:MDR family MFS transporter n=1 Tax=Heyndrickxia sp. NPDC080065 TaxID=3390568 RepID=UPI003D08B82B
MPRSLWLLVIGMMVNVTGSSFLWPLNAIYIHDHLGKSLTVAGIVLMLNSAASVIGNLIGGSLYDKIGGYRTILLGICITIFSLTGMAFWHGWPTYPILLTIIGFGSGIIVPAMFAMAGAVWKEGGRKAFNAVYIAQNFGVAVGSALGGLVASFSFDYIFLANLIMFILFFLIAFFGYKKIKTDPGNYTSVLQEKKVVKSKSKLVALMILCSAYLLCWVGYVQWQSTIATYTQEINISLGQYSMLWTINGALIVLGQPLVNPVVKWFGTNLKGPIITGIIIFMISFGIAGFANDFKGFLAAMIILTVGEMFVWPTVPTIADNLAPKGKEGLFQGIVNSTATGGRMIGPLLGGILVDLYNMSILFNSLLILLVISIILSLIYDRPLKTNVEKQTVSM